MVIDFIITLLNTWFNKYRRGTWKLKFVSVAVKAAALEFFFSEVNKYRESNSDVIPESLKKFVTTQDITLTNGVGTLPTGDLPSPSTWIQEGSGIPQWTIAAAPYVTGLVGTSQGITVQIPMFVGKTYNFQVDISIVHTAGTFWNFKIQGWDLNNNVIETYQTLTASTSGIISITPTIVGAKKIALVVNTDGGSFATFTVNKFRSVDYNPLGLMMHKEITFTADGGNEGQFLHPEAFDDRIRSLILTPSQEFPIAKIQGGQITVAPSTIPKIHLTYFRVPQDFFYGTTVDADGRGETFSPANSLDIEFGSEYAIPIAKAAAISLGIGYQNEDVAQLAQVKV